MNEPKIFVHSHFDWLKWRAFFLNQVFPCALKDDRAHVDKGNVYKNMHEYLFMTSHTGVFKMAVTRMGYFGIEN